ncbi:kinase-like domain-containing protein [Cladochytrium replicatum]|nr:kinase-like domain-containing protein [Cladochytrium replicatum]
MAENAQDNSHVNQYTLEKKIGKGQFSTVYRAKNVKDDTIVALKKVPIFEMMDLKSRNDCIKEIDLLRSLNHINVIKYYESFVENNELIIVLELADAGDLSKMIKHYKAQNKFLPERTVWLYFIQICAGLRHMHQKRIMHRGEILKTYLPSPLNHLKNLVTADIKPANVFVTAQGVVKLGDLGLGRFFSQNTSEAHSLVGTPYYMAPERIHENGYSFKSDVWSLGCLLYELAALQSPFYGEKLTLFGLCQKIEKCEYTELEAGKWSEGLRGLVGRMVQGDPGKRPDVEEVFETARGMIAKDGGSRVASARDGKGKVEGTGTPQAEPKAS